MSPDQLVLIGSTIEAPALRADPFVLEKPGVDALDMVGVVTGKDPSQQK